MSKLYINEKYITDVDYVAERLMSDRDGAHHYLIMRKENAPMDFFDSFPIDYFKEGTISLIELKNNNDEVTFCTSSFTGIQDGDLVREDSVNNQVNQAIIRFIKADANKQMT